jgi:phosphatidate cytidylyltransferase|tara:strand:- start:4608 stop:5396 length:789 start_codon:yes stop_codon:yes gene_type:complete
MLKNRIFTALAIAFFALVAIFALPLWAFSLFFLMAAGFGVFEWAGFAGLESSRAKFIYTGLFVVLAAALYLLKDYFASFIGLVAVLWMFAIGSILLYPRGESLYRNQWFVGALGLVIMLGAWVSLCMLRAHEQGAWWLVWLFVLTTATDVGAYFVGKAFGKNRLASQLSPGKTWEGALGGGVIATLICAATLVFWQSYSLLGALLLTIVLVCISVFGDLFESLLKRTSGVKDSGTILPGHGGVLDRIDSVIAVLPILTWVII